MSQLVAAQREILRARNLTIKEREREREREREIELEHCSEITTKAYLEYWWWWSEQRWIVRVLTCY